MDWSNRLFTALKLERLKKIENTIPDITSLAAKIVLNTNAREIDKIQDTSHLINTLTSY